MLALVALLVAAPAPVELRWDAPAECPSARDVEARVAEYTGGDAPSESLVVDAKIERVDERWHLRLAITDGEQTELRELDDVACEGLAESAAVLVAIAIAPERMGATAVPVPPEDPPASPAVAAPIDDPPAPIVHAPAVADAATPPPRPREPTHVAMRASGGASVGWLPIGGDVALALAFYWRWLRVELVGAYAPPRRVRFEDQRTSGADVSGWAVGVRACGVLHPVRWLDLPLCGGVEAGQVIGRPVRLDDGRIGRPAWVAGVVAPALRFVVHPRVALTLNPELLITFARPTLAIADEDPLFVATPAGARLHAGIELRFR
ncbi:MAG TPA: hypothetical protein VG755_21260 [Nannocystaceae bacterium]|nr:hypothetical protein [Nannocystaceae bacterium]